MRIFFFCGGKPLYMPRDLPDRSSVGESFLPPPGGGVDCSRSIWVSRVHEHISTASVLYKLARYTQLSISQSLPSLLLFTYTYRFHIDHGVKAAAHSKPAASNAASVVIEPTTPFLSEATTAITSSITAFSTSDNYEYTIDHPYSSLCPGSSTAPRWHTPYEPGRRTRETGVGAIWRRSYCQSASGKA